jgi:hypothetical protein
LKDSVPLSKAIPEEYQDLKEGDTFAITGIVLLDREKKGQAYKQAKINGLYLPDGKDFVKYRTSAAAVVRKCEDLLTRACFADGSCKKPVRVLVIGYDGTNGRGLDLADA